MLKLIMRNIRLLIQYDGTNYRGWQIQRSIKLKNLLTIQGILQDTLKKITGEDVKIIGAGRTDAGVHAIGQVASFKTGSNLPTKVIKRALNAYLPDDIRVIDCMEVDLNFHPRYDARSKRYFYVISLSDVVSPFFYRYVWRIKYNLDLDAMKEAIVPLIGCHDFSAFRASGCSSRNTIRTIYDISLEQLCSLEFMGINISGTFLIITIEANAFLRHMVRNIVGTLVMAGKDGLSPQYIRDILFLKDRKKAGQTAPAKGLFLEKVIY
jgi:tRNA pseudouridine38-40 synthase